MTEDTRTMTPSIDRRRFGRRALEMLALSLLAGCDRLASAPAVTRVLEGAESVTRTAQGLLVPRRALAQEFSEAALSPRFPPNGTTEPGDAEYGRHAASGWRKTTQTPSAWPRAWPRIHASPATPPASRPTSCSAPSRHSSCSSASPLAPPRS